MDLHVILAFGGALFAGALAFVSLLPERRNAARWLFGSGMILLGAESLCGALMADALLPAQAAYWQNWALYAMALLPGTWLAFGLSYARGNARQNLARWRWVLALAVLGPAAVVVLSRGGLVAAAAQVREGDSWTLVLRAPAYVLHFALLLGAVLVLMNLERTFRAAVGTMRWRIKFMLLGLGVLFAVRVYTSSEVLLFHTLNPSLQVLNWAALLVACLLVLRTLLRAGHFEVSVYPSQSLLHNSLTLMLAGIYLLLVGVFAKLVTWLGGISSFPLKAFLILVALVLASMALLSDRARLHARRFVSRYLQRPTYDYRHVWRTFTEGTARCVEQTELCGAIVKLVSDIFQALSVSLWLAEERGAGPKLAVAASSSLSEPKAQQLAMEGADAAEVTQALTCKPQPADIDSLEEPWTAALRRAHPGQFPRGGHRVCSPIMAGGELLGILVLGDRVGGVPFSLQDLELLKSVSHQAGASLLNIQLTQRLAQAKQLEAFQMMSAFFVHDLKNTASTLSLMLQNLPVHYQDPVFREDALRGIARTVTHINDLISRLGVLRHELAIQPVECDLNELVRRTLAGQEPTPGLELVQTLEPLPRMRIDPGQIQKVVTNLVLNAKEAVGTRGQVRVATSRRNDWVVLAVTDDGCGMSPEFVQNRLFRPFQTTKQRGIGIGMFHCKMIVEAHRGRIEVETGPGKGTAFRVLLPHNLPAAPQAA